MKAVTLRLIIVLLFSVAFFTTVLAQDGGDVEALNKLLTDGETTVTAGKLLAEVTFDDAEAWGTASDKTQSAAISKGVLTMALTGGTDLQVLHADTQTDTVIQVKTKQLSTIKENAYGVTCRADKSNNGDGYYFEISGDGFYTISVVDNGDTTALVSWTKSKAINTGEDENELTAVCAGNYLALYVNEVLVAETTDNTYTKGNTGLAISAFGGGKDVEIEFDDVLIWSATSDATPLAEAPITVAGPAEPVDSLISFDGEAKDAIRELEDLGMIPAGSSLIFSEDYAYFTGQGSWFTPLASRAPHQNIVMGGELTLTVGNTSKFESCTMTSRIKTDDSGTATTYIDVGIGNDNYAYIFDQYSEAQDGRFETGGTRLNLDKPHHVLFTLIDDVANVYVDGDLEISDFKIGERSGFYGIGLIGEGPKARCDGRNLWAFSVPNVQPGECAVNSASNANKRTGPGTNFEIAGQLVAGEDNVVSGQSKGADGKKWWQLEDETWVREDLVTAIGDCANIPITSPS